MKLLTKTVFWTTFLWHFLPSFITWLRQWNAGSNRLSDNTYYYTTQLFWR